jgi:hypothetical protein
VLGEGSRDREQFLGDSLHGFRHWLYRRPDDIKKHWILHPTFRARPLRLALFLFNRFDTKQFFYLFARFGPFLTFRENVV